MFKRKSSFIVVALMIVLAVIVTGCGASNTATTNKAPEKSGEANQQTPAKDAAATDTEAFAQQFRSYKTDKGTVEIPVKPLRIVTDCSGC
ncbi:hypothetical protein Back11_45540 [Paenibacillus baekrokdamisoli]|uniref:Uncharacterized protein n=1 Tax=Paenibacillus baekrokdamisoli TaxID=1712516 RepID=A0A3G9JJL7_9BACL|nr:ABC-type enterochelin transport system substrate-binding protein [Paenibacillus baekrokdamisoli]BBH23209.1 hypothetical protein Back11_45540 [Paenibacillus baekrokdamisoli]